MNKIISDQMSEIKYQTVDVNYNNRKQSNIRIRNYESINKQIKE